jgi:mono/diheme cytochrome c family protein
VSRAGPLVVGVVAGIVLVALVGLLVIGPAALVHRQTAALEGFYSDTMLNVVSARLASGAPVGGDGTGGGDAAAGQALYATTCAQCHGANGDAKGIYGFNNHPAATDLMMARTRGKSDAQILWIVKNGVSFSGMPAFGKQYSDGDLASVVAYVRQLEGNAK